MLLPSAEREKRLRGIVLEVLRECFFGGFRLNTTVASILANLSFRMADGSGND